MRVEIYTMCMVWDKAAGRVLLMNRPDRKGFPGYIAPGERWTFRRALWTVPCGRSGKRQGFR